MSEDRPPPAFETPWELEETPQRCLFVWLGPKSRALRRVIVSATAECDGRDRLHGRLIEQAPAMYELMAVVTALGEDDGFLKDVCRRLGGEWQDAFDASGRKGVRRLLTSRAHKVLDRVTGSGKD